MQKMPHVGSRVVRIDSLHFLARCHTRQLKLALSVFLRARCTDLTKWLTRELTIWLSVDALHETLTLG